MRPVFDGAQLDDGQLVVSTANSDVTNKRSEVDRQTYGRARCVIVNDWESVIDNDQTELTEPIEAGIISRDSVHEVGQLLNGKVSIKQPARSAVAAAQKLGEVHALVAGHNARAAAEAAVTSQPASGTPPDRSRASGE